MSAIQIWKVEEPYLQLSCGLGEAPFYEKNLHKLRFFDIVEQKLHILDLNKGPQSLQTYDVGTISTSAEIEDTDEEIIVGARSGFAILNRKTLKLDYICKVWGAQDGPGKEDRMRFNDGVVDPQGRYWAGTMNDPPIKSPTDEGVLFRLDPDKSLHRIIENVTIPNGMGWTLDRKFMYFTDSPTGHIFKYKFDSTTGDITNREVFFSVEKTDGEWPVPDGFAQDVDGNLWVALCGGGKVVKVNPEGKVLGEVRLPTRHITCPVFAAKELYITSAVEDEPEKYPWSVKFGGSLFRIDVGVEGAPVHKFKRQW